MADLTGSFKWHIPRGQGWAPGGLFSWGGGAPSFVSPFGAVFIVDSGEWPVADMLVLSTAVKAPVCGIKGLIKLGMPVVFHGRIRYEGDGEARAEDKWVRGDPRVDAERYLAEYLDGDFTVHSLVKGHPNVSRSGWVCPGSLGRPSREWGPALKARHLIGLHTMLSVPNFDNRLRDMGVKAARRLGRLLPSKIRRCVLEKG